MVSRILCFVVIVGVAHAATWQGYLPKKPLEFGCRQLLDEGNPELFTMNSPGAIYRAPQDSSWVNIQATPGSFPAHKQGCYVEEINDVIPFGEEVELIGHCYRVECSRHMMYYASCGVVSSGSENCFVTETDVSKPYPDCCPRVKCEADNNLI